MSLSDYIQKNLPTLNSVLTDTTEEKPEPTTELYQCLSYYDENNKVQGCTCGGCR